MQIFLSTFGVLLQKYAVQIPRKVSINLHLLRLGLAWQCKTFGPYWTTSASLFESVNHYLIRPVTGSLNTFKLFVHRYVREKEVSCSNFIVRFSRIFDHKEKRIHLMILLAWKRCHMLRNWQSSSRQPESFVVTWASFVWTQLLKQEASTTVL